MPKYKLNLNITQAPKTICVLSRGSMKIRIASENEIKQQIENQRSDLNRIFLNYKKITKRVSKTLNSDNQKNNLPKEQRAQKGKYHIIKINTKKSKY